MFPSDHLPKVNSHNACMIVNYSASDKSNEGHWCTILSLNNPGKNAYWFDSYGKFPDEDDTYTIKQILKITFKKIAVQVNMIIIM